MTKTENQYLVIFPDMVASGRRLPQTKQSGKGIVCKSMVL